MVVTKTNRNTCIILFVVASFFVFFILLLIALYDVIPSETKEEDFGEDGNVYLGDEQTSTQLDRLTKETPYLCSGECFCDDEGERRSISSSSILRKPIFYLVTSISSISAIHLAKEYFNSQCEMKLSNECPLSHILSEINDCERHDERNAQAKAPHEDEILETLEGFDYIEGLEERYTMENLVGKYFCRGFCVASQEMSNSFQSFSETVERSDVFGMNELDKVCQDETAGAFIMFIEDHIWRLPESLKRQVTEVPNYEIVKYLFAGEHLDSYCKESTGKTLQEIYDNEGAITQNFIGAKAVEKFGDLPVCGGYRSVAEEGIILHQDTACKKLQQDQ